MEEAPLYWLIVLATAADSDGVRSSLEIYRSQGIGSDFRHMCAADNNIQEQATLHRETRTPIRTCMPCCMVLSNMQVWCCARPQVHRLRDLAGPAQRWSLAQIRVPARGSWVRKKVCHEASCSIRVQVERRRVVPRFGLDTPRRLSRYRTASRARWQQIFRAAPSAPWSQQMLASIRKSSNPYPGITLRKQRPLLLKTSESAQRFVIPKAGNFGRRFVPKFMAFVGCSADGGPALYLAAGLHGPRMTAGRSADQSGRTLKRWNPSG